jgi:hypothetical protein
MFPVRHLTADCNGRPIGTTDTLPNAFRCSSRLHAQSAYQVWNGDLGRDIPRAFKGEMVLANNDSSTTTERIEFWKTTQGMEK